MPTRDQDKLRRYLADHDAPCPTCGYNLRGLRADACPECGAKVPAWVCPESREVLDRRITAAYLRDHDLICRYCKSNLRGSPDGVCPGCGRVYLARGYPPPGPVPRAPSDPRPLLGCILSGLALIVILAFIVRLSLLASP